MGASSMIASAADWGISILSRFATKSTTVITVDGDKISAGDLESAAGTLSNFFAKYEAAVQAKNYTAEFELGIEEAVTIASDVGVPYAGLAAEILPFVFTIANAGGFHVSPGDSYGGWESAKKNF
jgi:hypothetical protein